MHQRVDDKGGVEVGEEGSPVDVELRPIEERLPETMRRSRR